MMPNDPIVGGNILRRPAIQSPNFVSGVSGWSINADGTAQFNQLTLIVSVTGAAVLIYAGTAMFGTLIGSWAGTAGVDQYGNTYPPGISATGGVLNSITMNAPTIIGGILNSVFLTAPDLTGAALHGGTATETTITFDSVGGNLLCYTTTTTTQTITTVGQNNITIPAGVTVGKVETWGADAGAGGGSSAEGGEGGGAGEYACNPNYPLTPGTMVCVIGEGGQGGTTGVAGTSGGDTSFDNGGVIAQGGQAGAGFVGGQGGFYGLAPIDFAGGNGGGDGTQSLGGCGGGGRAGSTGAGGNGLKSTSGIGGLGGAAGTGTGGHAGGQGGASASNGNNGGGGGGAGAATASNQGSSQFRLSASETFFGSDASSSAPPNGQRGSGSMYQGGETASGGSFNGTMKSMGIVGGNPSGTLAGKTIDSVSIRLKWLHTWYNSGATVYLGYTNNASIPGSYGGASTAVKSWAQGNVGSPVTTNLTNAGLGSALQSGAAKAIIIGPGSGSFNLNNYGYMYGAGGDNNQNPLITVNWHTGSIPVAAGNGANGQAVITYSASSVLLCAISPVAGTDTAGNAYAAGYTGPVQAFHPGSNPTTVEGWQTLTPLPSGLTGSLRCKLVAELNIVLIDALFNWTGTAAKSFTLPSLPTGYATSIPGSLARIYTSNGNSTPSAVGALGRFFIYGSSLGFIVPATTGGGTASFTLMIPQN